MTLLFSVLSAFLSGHQVPGRGAAGSQPILHIHRRSWRLWGQALIRERHSMATHIASMCVYLHRYMFAWCCRIQRVGECKLKSAVKSLR